MDHSAESLARAIGARVRQERKAHEWTLEQLATSAGVSRRMLVSVEQGAVNPSIGTLLRLSDALGVGLPSLVEPPEPRITRVTRKGEGATLWRGALGGSGVFVTGTESPGVMELWDWILFPNEQHASESQVTETRELLQVQEGALVLEIDGDQHVLEAGDAIAFRSDGTHVYSNPHSDPVRFTLAVLDPGRIPAPAPSAPAPNTSAQIPITPNGTQQ